MSTPSVGDRCSLRSLAVDELLAGTASTIRHWLLIEHAGPWGRDGLLDARLPDGLGRELRTLEGRTGARVLLIRKPHRVPEYDDGTVLCFAADTGDAWLGFTAVGTIEDALELDPRDRSSFAGSPDPLFVVCTHGRRDPCCAERGRPLVEAARRLVPRPHLGEHPRRRRPVRRQPGGVPPRAVPRTRRAGRGTRDRAWLRRGSDRSTRPLPRSVERPVPRPGGRARAP